MFAFLPIIGPLIEGIVSLFTKYKDVELAKYKVDGSVDVDAMRYSADAMRATQDDIGVRFMRDLALFPPVAWSFLIGWDTIVAKRYPELKFMVADYPETVQYIPYMAFVFLFGAVGMVMWKRK